ncbi:hypothetical protein A2U01_0094184, partial [Trifolium medium]|nr:hypothetical protein [Trifolium medium]
LSDGDFFTLKYLLAATARLAAKNLA